ncbi:MAG: cytochrome c assembly protein [Bacteroidetes bacterium]|nr:MAG: cytochrome c assembly protein [Bacteroidota bacterium]
MDYLGESLLPGQLGHFLAILSFVASIVATIAFFNTSRLASAASANGWRAIGRWAFAVETVCVVGMFIVLYYIISHHLFEYKYAWQHSSRALQFEYLLSCFWEGQEGSFMLWSFWHCVLGWAIIFTAKTWAAPVMAVISLVQSALASMLLGLYFFGHKVGSSPFSLLRNEVEGPIFSRPDYLQFVKDGNGLNALLQNYWMVIHPPILFLGFASTVVPFAFAISGFLTKNHKGWTIPALPWALFSVAVLGTGIMMGAAWAYESLTFGGYWAWDPVENASLVPWLILVSGFHTNLIFKNSGYSLKATYLFYVLGFIFILYSTFLTRSGILGDTSVHAFTDLGMNVQLFLFLNAFIWLTPLVMAKQAKDRWLVLAAFVTTNVLALQWPTFGLISALVGFAIMGVLLNQNKDIPQIHKEENLYSREFWMFIGSLIFFLSAMVIIGKTSLPVYNKMFNQKVAPPADVEFSHNQIQIWVAIIAGILTAVTQYFKYKDTPKAQLLRKLLWPTLAAVAATALFGWLVGVGFDAKGPGFKAAIYVALFAAFYAIIANAAYVWIGINGKLKLSGPSVAHIGFGLVLLGILVSSANKTVLSINTTGISPLKKKDAKDVNNDPNENTTLIKGVPTDMGMYMVTYTKDTINPRDRKRYYEINFAEKTGKASFKLYPNVIENNKGGEGLTPNPDKKHYLGRDVFSYVTWLSDPDAKKKDTAGFRKQIVAIGDTNFYGNGMWVMNSLQMNPANTKFKIGPNDTFLVADITVISKDGRLYGAKPAFKITGNNLDALPDTVMSQSMVLMLLRPVDLKNNKLEVGIKESTAILDFITLKVYEFPGINILWLGIIITVIGILMSAWRRAVLMQRKAPVPRPAV